MSGDQLDVVLAALHTHAGHLRGASDTLAAAADRGAAADLGLETYGIIGQLFSLEARAHLAAVAGVIRGEATGLDALADGVVAASDAFEQVEERFRGVLGGSR